VLHATSGYDMANLDYQEGNVERPLKNGIFIADVLGGSTAFGAIQAALFRTLKTGQGDHVDVSLLDAMVGMLVYECQEAQFPAERRRPLYRPTQARDGFLLVAPVSQNNFEALARGVGHSEWISDARFATSSAREHHWSELMNLLDDWAASRTAAECEAILTEAGVPCSQYRTIRETMALPPMLTNTRGHGKWRLDPDALPPNAIRISREDVADFMMQQIDNPQWVRQAVYISW